MAINITAKNVICKVKEDYKLVVGGKLEKIADKMNVESTSGHLEIISNKRIVANSNKK